MARGYIVIGVILILMPFNWSLEALKWRLLTGKVVQLNFWNSLKGVVLGLGLSFFTPYAVGDYLGRIGLITHVDRRRLIGPLLIGRLVQLFITLIFGLLGVYYLFGVEYISYLLIAIIVFFAVFLMVHRGPRIKWKPKFISQIRIYFGLILDFDRRELLAVFTISFLRYFTFTLQFLLALQLFLPEVELHLKLAGITWVFFAKSIIPTFNFLSDLGIREVSAILFFEHYSIDIEPVILASLLIWIINLLLPTMLSLPLMFKLKIIR